MIFVAAIHYSVNLALKSLVSKRNVDDFLKIVYKNPGAPNEDIVQNHLT